MNFNSLFFVEARPSRRATGLRGGVINGLLSLRSRLLTRYSPTRDDVTNSSLFLCGINATIEVYIQYTDSLIEFLNSYLGITMREKILVIEDDEVMRELMRM